jgi:rRNA maturation endonuclease Nob1
MKTLETVEPTSILYPANRTDAWVSGNVHQKVVVIEIKEDEPAILLALIHNQNEFSVREGKYVICYQKATNPHADDFDDKHNLSHDITDPHVLTIEEAESIVSDIQKVMRWFKSCHDRAMSLKILDALQKHLTPKEAAVTETAVAA